MSLSGKTNDRFSCFFLDQNQPPKVRVFALCVWIASISWGVFALMNSLDAREVIITNSLTPGTGLYDFNRAQALSNLESALNNVTFSASNGWFVATLSNFLTNPTLTIQSGAIQQREINTFTPLADQHCATNYATNQVQFTNLGSGCFITSDGDNATWPYHPVSGDGIAFPNPTNLSNPIAVCDSPMLGCIISFYVCTSPTFYMESCCHVNLNTPPGPVIPPFDLTSDTAQDRCTHLNISNKWIFEVNSRNLTLDNPVGYNPNAELFTPQQTAALPSTQLQMKKTFYDISSSLIYQHFDFEVSFTAQPDSILSVSLDLSAVNKALGATISMASYSFVFPLFPTNVLWAPYVGAYNLSEEVSVNPPSSDFPYQPSLPMKGSLIVPPVSYYVISTQRLSPRELWAFFYTNANIAAVLLPILLGLYNYSQKNQVCSKCLLSSQPDHDHTQLGTIPLLSGSGSASIQGSSLSQFESNEAADHWRQKHEV